MLTVVVTESCATTVLVTVSAKRRAVRDNFMVVVGAPETFPRTA